MTCGSWTNHLHCPTPEEYSSLPGYTTLHIATRAWGLLDNGTLYSVMLKAPFPADLWGAIIDEASNEALRESFDKFDARVSAGMRGGKWTTF